jgi:hypothetical protein
MIESVPRPNSQNVGKAKIIEIAPSHLLAFHYKKRIATKAIQPKTWIKVTPD